MQAWEPFGQINHPGNTAGLLKYGWQCQPYFFALDAACIASTWLRKVQKVQECDASAVAI